MRGECDHRCNEDDETDVVSQREGLTFASVHDSYWTHAATVEGMSELIREAFIGLHTQDLVGELRKEVSWSPFSFRRP